MRKFFVGLLLLGAVIGGGYFSLGKYRTWRHAQQISMAKGFAASGDFTNALIALQQALRTGPDDVEACRMMAELSTMTEAPVSLAWRQRVVQLAPDSVPDLLALGRALLGAGQVELAAKFFQGIPTNAATDTTYHRLGSAVALASGDLKAAEFHAGEILRRDPTNLHAQLNLHSVRLLAADPSAAPRARASLEALLEVPALRREALRQLASEAVRSRDTNRALSLTAKLVEGTNAVRPDRILRMEALHLTRSPQLDAFLRSMEADSSRSSAASYELANWMVRNGEAPRAVSWLRSLPATVRTNQPVPVIFSDALAATTNWVGLLEFTEERGWGEVEFLRALQRSRAYRGLGSMASARAEWIKALQGAEGRLERLGSLYRNTVAWSWSEEPREALWEIVKRFPAQRWARKTLQESLMKEGQTRLLMSLLATGLQAEPGDADLKNDLALVALLLDAKEHRPHDTAKELRAAHPENPYYASTYALSLYLQGKIEESRRVLEALPRPALEEPSIAAYYGMILEASGDSAGAAKYLERGQQAPLLPEERKLLESARSTPSRH